MNFTNAKHLTINGKSAVRLEMGGGVVWKGLPEGYTLLDYIETTGTQYINTGFIPNQDSRIICEFMVLGGSGIYGARTTTAADNFAFRTANTEWQTCYGAKLYGLDIDFDTVNWHIAEQNRNKFYLDGVLRKTCTYAEFTAPTSIILGGINASNAVYYGKGRYRACQIYDNGVLVRDLIPCKDAAGNVGMYDTVNAVFYGNAGTGAFEYG